MKQWHAAVLFGAASLMLAAAWWWGGRSGTPPSPSEGSERTGISRAGPSPRVAPKRSPKSSARRVAGVVLDGDARMPSALVRLEADQNYGAAAVRELRSDAQGRFDFGEVPSLVYTVSASAPERTSVSLRIDGRTPDASLDAIVLRLTGCESRLLGRVFDSAGLPLPTAQVRIRGAAGVRIDETGAYALCVPTGRDEVIAEAEGYGSLMLTVDVSGRSERDIVLVPGGYVQGRVVLGDRDVPVPGASVSIFAMTSGPMRPAPASSVADDLGRFRIPVATGQFFVSASFEGFSTAMPTAVTVLFGVESGDLTLRLMNKTSKVGGVVVDGTQPVKGASVMSISKELSIRAQAVTDENGAFVLPSVRAGTTVFAVANWEVVVPREFEVTAEEEFVRIEVKRLSLLRGLVTRNGVPTSGARVDASSELKVASAVSNEHGEYEIRGLPPGTYEVLAQSDAVGAFGEARVTLSRSDEGRVLDIELSHGASISGSVVSKSGAVSGVTVLFTSPTTGDGCSSVTDARGSYECTKLTGGAKYGAEVFTPTGVRVLTDVPFPEVELARNQIARNVTLRVKLEMSTLKGVVVGSLGHPAPDVQLRAVADDGAAERRGFQGAMSTSDPQGRFTLSVPADGTWTIAGQAPDGASGALKSVASGAQDLRLVLEEQGVIEGTLIGYESQPTISTMDMAHKFSFVELDGVHFRTRVRPGKYLVTAMSASEGDAQEVEVKPGLTSQVELKARGTARIRGRVLEHRTGQPVAGLACHVVMRSGGSSGVTIWSLEAAPHTDARGDFVVERAPAGEVLVECSGNLSAVSRAAADLTLSKGQDTSVEMEAVRRTGDGARGFVGLSFSLGVEGPVVASVEAHSAASMGGFSVGELVVAVDGVAIGTLDSTGVEMLIANHPPGSSLSLTTEPGTGPVTRVVAVGAN